MSYLYDFFYGGFRPASNTNEQPIKDDQALRTKLKRTRYKISSLVMLTNRQRAEASKNVPKYLFRMWDARSGGNSKLNTTKAVTPLAFASSKGHNSVYDMTRTEFITNTSLHLTGCDSVVTEFSSWSHSPYFAFYFTMQRSSSGTFHVAIMDTEELAKSNPAFHVPALGKIFGKSYGYVYEEEYLVHGVIEGQFYKAVPYNQLCKLGLLKQLPGLNKSGISASNPNAFRLLPGEEENYTTDELRQLRKIVLPYGDTFSLPMAIVLFCCKKRPGYWSELSASDLDTIITVLGGWEKIPHDWCSSRSVFSKNVYPKNWDANEQVQNLMEALYTHCYGKGARGNEKRYAARYAKAEVDEEDIIGAMASMSVSRGDADEISTEGGAEQTLARKPTQNGARGFTGNK
ncbi:unnamed protein product [Aureobasidium vineae]|uniref:DUF7587 domain-containing protein n=1 Tax=Aureobasidium vineae TaxID=2773715 RepID=A0A9N8JEE8_9PEZI|nr:unnamed protein product [Aureobasidium vineae]